jgi:hypothetical protein
MKADNNRNGERREARIRIVGNYKEIKIGQNGLTDLRILKGSFWHVISTFWALDIFAVLKRLGYLNAHDFRVKK